MKKLTTALCIGLLGALAFAPAAQAGIADYVFECAEESDTNLKDYFCDSGVLYEVTVNCLNLDGGIGGALEIGVDGMGGSGFWNFSVAQGTEFAPVEEWDWVCEAYGIYGDSLKTELKCTDAPTGSNKGKPGNGNVPVGYDQADFTIKRLGEDESCLL